MRYRFCVVAFSSALALFGQEYRSTISGNISDQHGAGVAKVRIVAKEIRTGTQSETKSEISGAYTIPFLLPGEYEITAEAPGFKKFTRQGLTLSIGDHPVIDIRMEVGEVTQSVTVSADAPLIEAANGSVGQVISTTEVEDFPINGRTPMMLAHLALGVTSTYEPGPVRPFDNNGPNQTSIGGAPSGASETLVNGAPNAGFRNQLAYSPPQDAVQEVRVNAFDTDAAYGHSLGGTANQITKGGTNSLHGSAYEFNQTSKLDANTFFNNKNGIARSPYNHNQTGFTVGGPVWIPKVYNGRNRLFWFFAGERLKASIPQTSPSATGNPVYFATVPTPAERQGDFSALLKAGANYAIYDPTTGVVSGTQVQRSAFPNNVIPPSRLNPIALDYLKFYPQPNTSGRIDGFQNYIVNGMNVNDYTNELGRLDFNVTSKNKLYYDFRHTARRSWGTQYLGDGNPASGGSGWRINWGSTLDDVYTISPSTVLDLRLNWTRYIESNGNSSDGFDPTGLGFPSYIAQSSQYPEMPYIVFTNANPSGGSLSSFQWLGAGGVSNRNATDSFQIFTDVVKVRGNHTVKVGIDLREYRWSAFTRGNSAGTYTFNSNWTRGPLGNAAASPLGQDFAAFLLGMPSSGSFDMNAQSDARSRYYAFFVQEDWRVRSNLTLNLGVRWELETPTRERLNRAVSGFDPSAVNSVSAAAAAAYAASPIPQVPANQFRALGGLTFVNDNARDVYQMNSHIFSPRVGFAWTPKALGSRTVIRGGFGVFVAPIGIVGNASMGFNYSTGVNGLPALRQSGFSQTTQFVATNDNYLSPAATLSDPFPNGILRPVGSASGASTFLGQQVNFFNPDVRNPYALRWNFGIQHQLPGQMVLEVAYIGNHGVHLLVASTGLNSVPQGYLSSSPVRDTTTINLLGSTVTNPFRGLLPNSTSLNGATVSLQQLLVPYPQFPVGGVIMDLAGAGGSYYESLNIRLQKRFTHGLTLINNFVWNKNIDRLAYLNDGDPAPEKRTSTDSRPLREVLAATYRIPVGRGMHFDFHSRILNGVVGGWAVNGILTLQSGPQLAWGNVIYYGGPINLNAHQPDGAAFDSSRFNTASAQQLGSNIRIFNTQFNNLRRDASKNFDASLLKEIPFRERKYVQLRFEAYNCLNRVTFNAPDVRPTVTTFGLITGQANTERRVQVAARIVW